MTSTIEQGVAAGAAAPVARVTRATRAERIAYLDALAAHAKERAKIERDALEDEARREFTEQDTVPSWTLRGGLGTISGKQSRPSISVTDADALLAWVEKHHPENVQTIKQVRPAFLKALCEVLGEPVGTDGSVGIPAPGDDDALVQVPGLTYTEGGRFVGIAVTIERTYKDVAMMAAANGLHAALRLPGAPFDGVPADVDVEGAAMVALEAPGELTPSEV